MARETRYFQSGLAQTDPVSGKPRLRASLVCTQLFRLASVETGRPPFNFGSNRTFDVNASDKRIERSLPNDDSGIPFAPIPKRVSPVHAGTRYSRSWHAVECRTLAFVPKTESVVPVFSEPRSSIHPFEYR